MADAAAAVAKARHDPVGRIDALELMREVLIAKADFERALELSTEIVAERKQAARTEPILYAFALVSHAVVTYGADKPGEADRALLAARDAFRLGYSADDPRLAGALEQLADRMVEWNRPAFALSLRREALVIREKGFPAEAGRSLADPRHARDASGQR
jgi:hypothetical protein